MSIILIVTVTVAIFVIAIVTVSVTCVNNYLFNRVVVGVNDLVEVARDHFRHLVQTVVIEQVPTLLLWLLLLWLLQLLR